MRFNMACDVLFTATSFVQNIFVLLSVIVGLIIVISSLFYMFGSIFNQEKYKSFAKKEFYNLAISLFLMTMFLPIVSVVESVTCDQNNVSLYDFTISRMNSILYGEIYPVLSNVYKMTIWQQGLGGIKVNFGVGVFKPLGFLNELSKSLSLTNFILEMMFTSIYIQSLALIFLKVTSFNIFFPLGILFRAIPYLREYGNFLMAFSISLSTIFPFMFYISIEAYYDAKDNLTFEKTIREQFQPYGVFSSAAQTLDDSFFYILSCFKYGSLRDMFFMFGRILFLAVGVPALAIIFTVACTSSISKFLKEIGA